MEASDLSLPHFYEESDNPSISRAILGLLREDDKVIGLRVKSAYGTPSEKSIPREAYQVESLSASITRDAWEKISGKYWFGFDAAYRALLDSGRMLEPFVFTIGYLGPSQFPQYMKHLKKFISQMNDMSEQPCAYHVDQVQVTGNLRVYSVLMMCRQESLKRLSVIDPPPEKMKFARVDAATFIVADNANAILHPFRSWPSYPVLEWGDDLTPTNTMTIGEVILELLDSQQVVVGLQTSGAEAANGGYFSMKEEAAVSERFSRK